jgi:two-component system cell cycle response regulator CpdR
MNETAAATTKILLAEDDNDMRRFLVRALQNAGFDVASFDNGLSAYNRLREEPFELLLTDIVMPEMDGIEALKAIWASDPNATVVMCSAMGQQNLMVEALQAGAKEFIVKPFQADKVLEVINRHAA